MDHQTTTQHERIIHIDWLSWKYWIQSVPSDDWEGIQCDQLETYAKHMMPRIWSLR